MLDFDITFDSQEQFQFIDNSNTSDYTGLGTVDKTDLQITYPVISDNTAIVVDLYDENISTLTDNFIYTTTNTPTLSSFVDGVYRVVLDVLDSNPTSLGDVTKYFVQDYSIKECIKAQVENALDNEPKSWCEISRLNAILDSAHWEASQDNWENAQNMIDYLTNECIKLNCAC